VIVKRRKEGDSQATVRHGVQETMASGRQEEIQPDVDAAKAGQDAPKSYEQHSARQECGEKERVRESPMAPEITVTDTESESDHIKVGYHRADCSADPNSFWGARAIKTYSYPEGCHRVRKGRGHLGFPHFYRT
jgi:hypothetical protein